MSTANFTAIPTRTIDRLSPPEFLRESFREHCHGGKQGTVKPSDSDKTAYFQTARHHFKTNVGQTTRTPLATMATVLNDA